MTSLKALQMAMNGFLMSSDDMPVARIKVRCGARSGPFFTLSLRIVNFLRFVRDLPEDTSVQSLVNPDLKEKTPGGTTSVSSANLSKSGRDGARPSNEVNWDPESPENM